MQHLIFKKNLSRSKMKALLNFLKSWGIDAELKTNAEFAYKVKSDFSLSAGLWEDIKVDSSELRKQAWSRN